MAIRWDIARKVREYLRDNCSPADNRVFGEALHAVLLEPLGATEPFHDARISRYMLRFFRFGRNIAIVELRIENDLLYVRECRKLPFLRVRPRAP